MSLSAMYPDHQEGAVAYGLPVLVPIILTQAQNIMALVCWSEIAEIGCAQDATSIWNKLARLVIYEELETIPDEKG